MKHEMQQQPLKKFKDISFFLSLLPFVYPSLWLDKQNKKQNAVFLFIHQSEPIPKECLLTQV